MNTLQLPKPVVPAEETSQLWQQRTTMEGFLRQLRERGAFQIESIKAVRECAGVSLGKAKEIVHFSATWADMRESADLLHETAYAALEQFVREDEFPERLAS